MLERIKTVNNPLTIVAIFAALAEVAGTIALQIVSSDLQATFIWFVMLFPVLLVLLFFLTLNINPKVLYAPSDFKNDESFLAAIRGVDNLSSNLEEVEKRLESAKSQIIDDAIKQISIASEQERSRLKEIVDLRIDPVQKEVETTRDALSLFASTWVPHEKPTTIGRYISAKLPTNTSLDDNALLEVANMLIRDQKADAINKLCSETTLDKAEAKRILSRVNVQREKDLYLRSDRGEL